ncbi:hypothetical protein AKJ40_01720 [candidate division MSBL1 archaeon SCGC-AAA259M10]|uniref:Leucine-binding protein domain-containing protein n=1 Tax=candidate division MSBL1 archaeon SCGC-AAA259M10 TaxID=1698270 RepID=A0A133V198_9EURY|nr:hypothetical protein AKJ40_01720 [candidate division MSBL1 archaeon SCGC-AAA259M10]
MKDKGQVQYAILGLVIVSIIVSGASLAVLSGSFSGVKEKVNALSEDLSNVSSQLNTIEDKVTGMQKKPGEEEKQPARKTSQEPIKIGTLQPVTGQFAAAGRNWLITMRMWEERINSGFPQEGGLPLKNDAGETVYHPVKIIQYDSASDPSKVPGLVSKLLNIDKVDILFSSYSTNMTKPGMPLASEEGILYVGDFATDANEDQNYSNYVSMIPNGPTPSIAWSKAFLQKAKEEGYTTVASLITRTEMNEGIHNKIPKVAENLGMEMVYHKTAPPGTTSFDSMFRAIKAKNPDVVYCAAYPTSAVAMIKTVNSLGYTPKMIGGGLIGLQYTSVMQSLGSSLNGWIVNQSYAPNLPEVKAGLWKRTEDVVSVYQKRVKGGKADQLGYYITPPAWAGMQVVEKAIRNTKSTDGDKLADYIFQKDEFKTVWGRISFSREARGEWTYARWLWPQIKGLEEGSLKELRQNNTWAIVANNGPYDLTTGKFVPYDKLRQQ